MNKQLLLPATLLVVSCVQDSPLVVDQFFPTTAKCDFNASTTQGGGAVNISSGIRYTIRVDMKNNLEAIDYAVEGAKLDNGIHRNSAVLEQKNLSYTSPGFTFINEASPLVYTIPPGATGKMITGLIGPEAAKVISDAFNPRDGGLGLGSDGGLRRMTVKVGLTYDARIQSGSRISSAPIVFPISFYEGGFPFCPGGVEKTGPCGDIGGQDDFELCCVPDGGMPQCKKAP